MSTTYFRNAESSGWPVPEEHEWLAFRDGHYLFPMKDSDIWTEGRPRLWDQFEAVDSDKVPSKVRRKTGHRYGAWKRKRGLP
jgi:hypothetical protein